MSPWDTTLPLDPASAPTECLLPPAALPTLLMPTSTQTGVLLVNLGTPDAPRKREVRRYLREFLSDPRVLDLS
ncbi:MAG: hypothetical protein ACI82F_003383, partial [Planctomycetota bacterium]